MSTKKRMLLLAIAISCMLGASAVHVQIHPRTQIPIQSSPQTLSVNTSFRFQSIINESFYGTNSSTTLFSPFTFSQNNLSVHGKYVDFVLGYGGYGPEIFNFHLNQSPISGFSAQLFSSMSFLSASLSSLTPGVRGPIFYVYSNSLLLIIHDDPQGIIQLYSNNETVYTTMSLSDNMTFSGKLQSGMLIQKGFSAVTYSNANMTGYIMTGGSNLSLNSTSFNRISGYDEIQTALPAYSFLSSFQVPNTVSALSSALSYLAQGMASGVVSYVASATLSGSSFSYESSFSVPSIAVTSVSAARNNIHVAVGSSGVNSPATMVFLFDGAIYNLTASQAYVYVNGARISHQAGLTSILMNGPGNLTSYNVTHIGSYTLVAISSPSQISDIRLSTASSPGFLSSVSGAASGLIPLVAALSVISIASVALYRRKSREES